MSTTATEHQVELNYSVDPATNKRTFSANPKTIKVNCHDTIAFRKGGTTPPDGELHVTFRDPEIFSSKQFHDGDQPVKVVAKPIPTSYHCALMVNGELFAESSGEDGGGDILPGTET
jgi:hypothetical protein